ncbi:GTPase IMAP family member 9 [Labeo rohita]|uniref:GTPase IMAP family member 9 n=1 Tax=Labeo rohita TaxID=84645 RepID=A0ABQ8LB33_LABRO|nr:GTPase IMAP family member 9 [Labeo rohita]
MFNTSMSKEDIKSEIEKCVFMSVPVPHVFLLVIRLGVRFTDEEKKTVKWIQDNFGEKAIQYTIVLFTHKDQIDLPIEEYIETSTKLKKLVNECTGGYHHFNNKDKNIQAQVIELLEKIDRLIQSNGR